MYYIVEVNGTHIGIEHGSTRSIARRNAIQKFGRQVTSATTRAVTREDVDHILAMGGYVPLSVLDQFGIARTKE